jgi:hypothetical protein
LSFVALAEEEGTEHGAKSVERIYRGTLSVKDMALACAKASAGKAGKTVVRLKGKMD